MRSSESDLYHVEHGVMVDGVVAHNVDQRRVDPRKPLCVEPEIECEFPAGKCGHLRALSRYISSGLEGGFEGPRPQDSESHAGK